MVGEINILYSYAQILAKMEDGDSLTRIFQKTKLSYVTIRNSVSELEKKGIIRTEEEQSRHGKTKKCFFVEPLKEQSYAFLKGIEEYKKLFSWPE